MPTISSPQQSPMTSFVSSAALTSFIQKPQTMPYNTLTSPLLRRRWQASSTPRKPLITASVTMPGQKVRTYTNEDSTPVEELASSLASAFENDPLMRFVTGLKGRDLIVSYKSILKFLLNAELSRPTGQTTFHVSEDDSTVAVWHHVNHWKVPFTMQLMLPFVLLRTIGWSGAMRFLKVVDRIEEYHPTEPHMHLFIIGTHAEMRGKGNGSAVISKMLHYCDYHEIPAYLESSSELNLPFYKRHGFKITKKIPNLPQDCPPVFAMWREPKPILDNMQD